MNLQRAGNDDHHVINTSQVFSMFYFEYYNHKDNLTEQIKYFLLSILFIVSLKKFPLFFVSIIMIKFLIVYVEYYIIGIQ